MGKLLMDIVTVTVFLIANILPVVLILYFPLRKLLPGRNTLGILLISFAFYLIAGLFFAYLNNDLIAGNKSWSWYLSFVFLWPFELMLTLRSH